MSKALENMPKVPCIGAGFGVNRHFHDLLYAWFIENEKSIRAALSNTWRPIDTAPRDGAKYLGWCGGEPFVAFYDEDDGHRCEFQTEPYLHVPTKWKPLDTPEVGNANSP